MSRTDNFVKKYTGKRVNVTPEWREALAGECVSLVQRFIIEEIGAKAIARGNGKAWRTVLINEGLGYRVDRKDIQKGDIIAWGGNYGHVAISLGGDKIFESVGRSVNGAGVAVIGSASKWDKSQGEGLVTRLNDFVDAIPSDEKPKLKSLDEVAKEVVDGKWGNGKTRKDNLTNKGYDYDKVQKRVNELLNVKEAPKLKSIATVAQEVVDGKWGNNPKRKNDLIKAGYDYNAVQAKVNELIKGKAPSKPTTPSTVKLGGKTRLFVNATGSATYPVPSTNKYTTLAQRTVSVLKEQGNRYQVRIPKFKPEVLWISKDEVK